MKTGMAQRIREAAKKLGIFSARELAGEVGVQSGREVAKVRDALRDFRRRGEIIHLARGCWKYCGTEHTGRGIGVQERVYRAMYTRRTFAARDLVVLTDASETYIRMLIRRLAKAGRIRKIGDRPRPLSGTRRKEAAFGLTDPDGFYLEFMKGLS